MKVKPRVPEGGAIVDDEETNAENYSAVMKKTMAGEYRRFVRYVVDTMQPPKGAKILEIGPGPGWITIWLAQARPDLLIEGLEASPDMIRQANKSAVEEGVSERVHFIHGFVEKMDTLSPDSYDVVISNGSLHHWENPISAFKEIARVLKPEGWVFIQDGRRDLGFRAKFIVEIFGRLIAGKNFKFWKSSIAAGYTPSEIKEILDKASVKNWKVRQNFMDTWIEKYLENT